MCCFINNYISHYLKPNYQLEILKLTYILLGQLIFVIKAYPLNYLTQIIIMITTIYWTSQIYFDLLLPFNFNMEGNFN